MGVPGSLPLIREAGPADLPAILRITNDAIENTDALWITTPLRWSSGASGSRTGWHRATRYLSLLIRLVRLLGMAPMALSGPMKAMLALLSIRFMSPPHQRRGVGRSLLHALINHARDAGFHIMVAGITADNAASVAMHHEFGFGTVARCLRSVANAAAGWICCS